MNALDMHIALKRASINVTAPSKICCLQYKPFARLPCIRLRRRDLFVVRYEPRRKQVTMNRLGMADSTMVYTVAVSFKARERRSCGIPWQTGRNAGSGGA
jgi:hypothetical protein